ERTTRVRCSCGGLLTVNHRLPFPVESLRASLDTGGLLPNSRQIPSGVWRFGPIVNLLSMDKAVSHPEGNTPLLDRPAVARWCGLEHLLLKHEGYNPTGSFKDRGMTVAVTQAVRIGAR